MKTKYGQNYGFTMIEIMIVVFIVGVLVAVALPAYQSHVAKTELNRCYSYLTSTRLITDNLIQLSDGAADGIVASDLGFDVNVANADCDAGLAIANATSDGNITLRGSSNVPGIANAVVLSLVRTGANGTWSCTSNAASSGLTPELCP